MIVYTDGACKGNPGVGGYACVMLPTIDSNPLIIAGGEAYTTNNRMELLAVVSALEYLAKIKYGYEVIVYTDSQYISRAINEGWLSKWLDKSFDKIKNKDLWLRVWKYLCLLNVRIEWVKAHADNKYNNLADKFAQQACFFQGKEFNYTEKI